MGICYEDDHGCPVHGKQSDILELLEALQPVVTETREYVAYESDDYKIFIPRGKRSDSGSVTSFGTNERRRRRSDRGARAR